MSRFLPCPSCSRHVRTTEPSCPFCQAPMPAVSTLPAPTGDVTASVPRVRMGRIAVLAAGAALIGTAASCDGAKTPADSGSGGQTMTGSGGGNGNATGGTNGLPDAGTGGSSGNDAAQEAPIAIYAAAIALPRKNNQG